MLLSGRERGWGEEMGGENDLRVSCNHHCTWPPKILAVDPKNKGVLLVSCIYTSRHAQLRKPLPDGESLSWGSPGARLKSLASLQVGLGVPGWALPSLWDLLPHLSQPPTAQQVVWGAKARFDRIHTQ